MPTARFPYAFHCASALALAVLLAADGAAQTIWSGYDFTFTKLDFYDPTEPENQDRITENVWLTRDVQAGLFNINQEAFYSGTSPAGTEWATYINNPSATVAATNHGSLTFTNWRDAYQGFNSFEMPSKLVSGPAVVHLITDDIFFDIQFTSWTAQAGGGFSYNRAEAPAAPTTTGDYNGNGVVDAADYVLWRKTLNQSAFPAGSGADGDADGTVDADDYTFWRARFGNLVAGAGSGGTAIPEPASCLLLLAGVLMARIVGRRR